MKITVYAFNWGGFLTAAEIDEETEMQGFLEEEVLPHIEPDGAGLGLARLRRGPLYEIRVLEKGEAYQVAEVGKAEPLALLPSWIEASEDIARRAGFKPPEFEIVDRLVDADDFLDAGAAWPETDVQLH